MRSIWRWSLMGMVVVAMSQAAHADFEVVVEQQLSLENAEVLYEGYEGQQALFEQTIINGSDIAEPSTEWTVNFVKHPFTDFVPAERGIYMLWRTEPDATPEDGPGEDYLRVGDNFEMIHAAIPAGIGSASVSFSELPPLGAGDAVEGDYSFIVAELPETKLVYDPETDTSTEEPYTDEDFMEWFRWTYGIDFEYFEGEVPETYAPAEEKTFSFTYNATAELVCCSSVLFIPGIKGSVLKSGSDTLWPPTVFSNDIPQLALNEDGTSIIDIEVDGVLNSFYGRNIYGPFSESMDTLVEENVMHDWLPLAYDWRYLPEQIIDDGIVTPSGIVDPVAEIEVLAANATNGKVTIVAHSMGGLLGKAIIAHLEAEGKVDLIESFVLVGSPQLGTPQAIGSVLHGDSEGIAAGFIVDPRAARSLSLDLPSTYALFPSSAYFEEVDDPVVVFDPNADFTESWRSHWGTTTLGLYPQYKDFITGKGVARENPDAHILRIPEVARADLFEEAEQFHATYDTYEVPEHVRVVQIAGWGLPTAKAVEYRERHWLQSYERLFTREGDGTVVYPSAVSSAADETYYFNLDLFRDSNNKQLQHRDFLGADPVITLLESILFGENVLETHIISISKPQVTGAEDQLLVSTHSPVLLGVRDEDGNFTGIDPDQDNSSGILMISEEIPGSSFVYSSESQYIFLPDEGEYRFVYEGTGTGLTTISLSRFSGDAPSSIAEYSDIATTEETIANFTLDADAPTELAIEVDENGDGTIDNTVFPDGVITVPEEENLSSGSGSSRSIQSRPIKGEEKVAVQVLNARLIAMAMNDMRSLLEGLKARFAAGVFDSVSPDRLMRVLLAMEVFIRFLQQLRGTI